MNPYKIIEGKTPKHKDLETWVHDRWMDFFSFVEFFIVIPPEGEEYLACPMNKIKEMEGMLEEPNHTWHEFIWRIGRWADKTTPKEYYSKLNSILLNCLTYLKRNPAAVTNEMRAFITIRHPKIMGWCLEQYEVKEVNGVDVVTRDTETPAGKVDMPSFQKKMMTSMVKLADVYETLVTSINKSDIRTMTATEKFRALQQLGFIFNLSSKKVVNNTFTQVNVNTNDARSLEKLALDYSKKKTND